MRSYAMEDADASLVNALADYAQRISDRYFGRIAPKLPSGDMIAFEEKWRKVHLNGPITKGSAIDSDTVSRQI